MSSNEFKQTDLNLYKILADNFHHEGELDDNTIISTVIDYIKSKQENDKNKNLIIDQSENLSASQNYSKNIYEAMQDYIYYSDFDILKEITDDMLLFDSEYGEIKPELTEICNQILKEYENDIYTFVNNEGWRCYLLKKEKLDEYIVKYSKKYFENNEKENFKEDYIE